MNSVLPRALPAALVACAAVAAAWQAWAGGELVKFPEDYALGVHYATVNRGNIREELFTSREAIEAAKKGEPFPSGAVITMEDYRDGRLYRYVVMEKRTGWGSEYPPDQRNGEWEFQSFAADRTVNGSENLARCFSCHTSRARQDFVWTTEQMRSAP
jgi:hypothetical protein